MIYFDEVWKVILDNEYILENIYNMYKTLRKKKAGICIISQDISDIFGIDDGNFGKSILNNSNLKALFKMEWADIDILDKMRITKDKLDLLKELDKGQGFVSFGNTNFVLDVRATDFEHKLIEGVRKEEYEENISWNG